MVDEWTQNLSDFEDFIEIVILGNIYQKNV